MRIQKFQVFKPGISLAISLSAMLGYLVYHPRADTLFYLTGISTFLLCTGGGALNNCQDRNRDAAFQRTRNRALACGTLDLYSVLLQSIFLILLGFSSLGFTREPLVSMGLGLAGVLLYNGVYTPLKSKTILAIIPGALCGMVPPAMGWAAAGGNISMDTSLLLVMVIFGIWQLPHFWLILLTHENDYQNNAVPSMLTFFSVKQLEQILFVWVMLFSSMILMTPLFIPRLSPLSCIVLGINAMGMVMWFSGQFFLKNEKYTPISFIVLNMGMGVFMTVIIMDRLLGG
ncbi:protoheme IX farnesyltransferase [Desulfocicer vacuolatum]|uniref:protoheme IX farnesyltransferase n=1 Tax=Desulfocicer vacuolatum TaxID=2298 RepID=UPI001BAFB217|nr:UbiA family prenyltransferase [Desulfocicer vacuolatum]